MSSLILLLVRLGFRRYEQVKFFNLFYSFQQLLKYSIYIVQSAGCRNFIYCNFSFFTSIFYQVGLLRKAQDVSHFKNML